MKSKKLSKKLFKKKKSFKYSKSSKKILKNKKKITKKIKKRNMIGGLKNFDATVSLNNQAVPNQYKVILSEKLTSTAGPPSPPSTAGPSPPSTAGPPPHHLKKEDDKIFTLKKSIEDKFENHLKFSPNGQFIVVMIKNVGGAQSSIYRIKLDELTKDETSIGNSTKFIVVKKDEDTLFVIIGDNQLKEVTNDSLSVPQSLDNKEIDAFDYSTTLKYNAFANPFALSKTVVNINNTQITLNDFGNITKLLFSQNSQYIIGLSNNRYKLIIFKIDNIKQLTIENVKYFTFYGLKHILYCDDNNNIVLYNLENDESIILDNIGPLSSLSIIAIFERRMFAILFVDGDTKILKLYKINDDNTITEYFTYTNMISCEENSFGYFKYNGNYYFAICTNNGLLIYEITPTESVYKEQIAIVNETIESVFFSQDGLKMITLSTLKSLKSSNNSSFAQVKDKKLSLYINQNFRNSNEVSSTVSPTSTVSSQVSPTSTPSTTPPQHPSPPSQPSSRELKPLSPAHQGNQRILEIYQMIKDNLDKFSLIDTKILNDKIGQHKKATNNRNSVSGLLTIITTQYTFLQTILENNFDNLDETDIENINSVMHYLITISNRFDEIFPRYVTQFNEYKTLKEKKTRMKEEEINYVFFNVMFNPTVLIDISKKQISLLPLSSAHQGNPNNNQSLNNSLFKDNYKSLKSLLQELKKREVGTIFVFDLDNTLIKHTGGRPSHMTPKPDDNQEIILKALFEKIKKNANNIIIILSRGIETQIRTYFANQLSYLILPEIFILGSNSIEDLIKDEDNGGKQRWARQKSRALKLIQETLNANVMFYDDEQANIEQAKALKNPQINAFLVNNTTNVNESYTKIFDIYKNSILEMQIIDRINQLELSQVSNERTTYKIREEIDEIIYNEIPNNKTTLSQLLNDKIRELKSQSKASAAPAAVGPQLAPLSQAHQQNPQILKFYNDIKQLYDTIKNMNIYGLLSAIDNYATQIQNHQTTLNIKDAIQSQYMCLIRILGNNFDNLDVNDIINIAYVMNYYMNIQSIAKIFEDYKIYKDLLSAHISSTLQNQYDIEVFAYLSPFFNPAILQDILRKYRK